MRSVSLTTNLGRICRGIAKNRARLNVPFARDLLLGDTHCLKPSYGNHKQMLDYVNGLLLEKLKIRG